MNRDYLNNITMKRNEQQELEPPEYAICVRCGEPFEVRGENDTYCLGCLEELKEMRDKD